MARGGNTSIDLHGGDLKLPWQITALQHSWTWRYIYNRRSISTPIYGLPNVDRFCVPDYFRNFSQNFSKFFKRLTHSLCVSLLKNLWHRVNRTVGCSDCTIRKAKSKIFKNWQTAWTVQSFGLQTAWTANSPKRPDRPKSWYCPNRLNSSSRAISYSCVQSMY